MLELCLKIWGHRLSVRPSQCFGVNFANEGGLRRTVFKAPQAN